MTLKLMSAEKLYATIEETVARHDMTVEEFLKIEENHLKNKELIWLWWMIQVSMIDNTLVAAFLQAAFSELDDDFDLKRDIK